MREYEINRLLNEWLKNNGFNNIEVLKGEEFLYDNGRIEWNENLDDLSDTLFEKFCYMLGLKFYVGNFLLSFFHELGHYVTLNKLPNYKVWITEKIQTYLEDKKTTKLNYTIYAFSPRELPATKWAIKYINSHYSKIAPLYYEIEKLL